LNKALTLLSNFSSLTDPTEEMSPKSKAAKRRLHKKVRVPHAPQLAQTDVKPIQDNEEADPYPDDATWAAMTIQEVIDYSDAVDVLTLEKGHVSAQDVHEYLQSRGQISVDNEEDEVDVLYAREEYENSQNSCGSVNDDGDDLDDWWMPDSDVQLHSPMNSDQDGSESVGVLQDVDQITELKTLEYEVEPPMLPEYVENVEDVDCGLHKGDGDESNDCQDVQVHLDFWDNDAREGRVRGDII